MTEETVVHRRTGDAEGRQWLREGAGAGAPLPSGDEPRAFHRTIPGYRVTPLVDLPALAADLGVASVLVKDESDRFGLPAFKALGASWAINRAIGGLLGRGPAGDFAQLEEWCRELGGAGTGEDGAAGSGVCLVTASDGNHGKALAHMAAWLGLSSRIYVPAGLPASTIDKIAGEGAEVVETGLTYDGAVALAASAVTAVNEGYAAAGEESGAANEESDAVGPLRRELLIQDTAWDGYREVPGWIVGGYSTLVAEVDEQLGAAPDLILVPTGVGSLLQSVVEHYRGADSGAGTKVVAVEPVTADCVVRSMTADRPLSVDTVAPTSMAGLSCGTVSALAWPVLRAGLDGAVSVTDTEATAALRVLHDLGVAVGPCGAASLAGARRLLSAPGAREGLGLSADAQVVLVSTESAAANEGLEGAGS